MSPPVRHGHATCSDSGLPVQGYGELLHLLAEHRDAGGANLHLDVYGSGEDIPAIKAAAEKQGLDVTFHEGTDHQSEQLRPYRRAKLPCEQVSRLATSRAGNCLMHSWAGYQANLGLTEDAMQSSPFRSLAGTQRAVRWRRVFVNPSTSDVVATTSCEALAMGKWLICAGAWPQTTSQQVSDAAYACSSPLRASCMSQRPAAQRKLLTASTPAACQ